MRPRLDSRGGTFTDVTCRRRLAEHQPPGQHPFVIAFTHGHVVNSPDRMLDWWKGQAFGHQKAGEADMLVSAHFHHYRNRAAGKRRTWLQIPALSAVTRASVHRWSWLHP